MAEKAKETETGNEQKKADATAAGGGGLFALLPSILNTVGLLAAAGLLYYTRFLYHRPTITESGERARLAELRASPAPVLKPAVVSFQRLTVNIASNPMSPQPADGTGGQLEGKLHYVTFAMSLEIRDAADRDVIDEIRPFLLDQLLGILGKKRFNELNSVEGRYVLRSQILDLSNAIIAQRVPYAAKNGGIVTNVFFTEFILQ